MISLGEGLLGYGSQMRLALLCSINKSRMRNTQEREDTHETCMRKDAYEEFWVEFIYLNLSKCLRVYSYLHTWKVLLTVRKAFLGVVKEIINENITPFGKL